MSAPATAVGPRWRAGQERIQEAVIPSGRLVVSCSAALGAGGLGRHAQEIMGVAARRGEQATSISSEPGPTYRRPTLRESGARMLAGAALGPARVSRGWRTWRESVTFDNRAAVRLPSADHLIGFNGQALAQLRAARRGGYRSATLMSANSHVRRVQRQHALARRQYPLEPSWATHVASRNIAEYAAADVVYVSSRYAWESFVEEGFPQDKLSFFPLTPAPRFLPGPAADVSQTYDIVYVGSLSVAKGVALLVDAVRRLAYPDLRLVLVGGAGTRGMTRFIAETVAQDSRIQVAPGDPLPHLHRARLGVHAAYEDGFAYAPAEALACGLPVIVSEDTGMKELIGSPRDGLIVPTGDLGALTETIECAYRGEIFNTPRAPGARAAPDL